MAAGRPFRFDVGITFGPVSAVEPADRARRAEALGYAGVVTADHVGVPLTPVVALTAAACATTTLRVRAFFDNDFRHPAFLAMEAASLDVLSGGRFDFTLGAGWDKGEYSQVGIPFDPPGVRLSRLQEAILVVRGLWSDGPFTFAGRYYTITGLEGMPKPVQRPHPPIFIGGGGKRLLSFAAREADVVGIVGQARPEGGLDIASMTEATLGEKVGWVRAAAGERFDRIDLHLTNLGTVITDDREGAAERLARETWHLWALTPEQILRNPCFRIGSIDQIVETLIAQRERYGISYITVAASVMESFAPVVARLS